MIDRAESLLRQNASELSALKADCEAKEITIVLPSLELNATLNKIQSRDIRSEAKWNLGRKQMREAQNFNQSQQSALPSVLEGGSRGDRSPRKP
jgi:hypothetical protein